MLPAAFRVLIDYVIMRGLRHLPKIGVVRCDEGEALEPFFVSENAALVANILIDDGSELRFVLNGDTAHPDIGRGDVVS